MNTQFDIAYIRSKQPCYDPTRYLPEGWKGSVKGILRHRDIPAKDKLWVVLREGLIDDKTLRLFAVACAREALKLIPNPDARSIEACDIIERFAYGKATIEELKAATAAAYAAYADADDADDAAAATYVAAARAVYDAAAATYVAAARAVYDAYVVYADTTAHTYARTWQVNKLLELLGE